LPLPNKATGSEKPMPKSAGPNNASAASSTAARGLPETPIQPSPTQQ
jgi:hypothetical protein